MPRMIVSIDGVVIKEVQLTKERTTPVSYTHLTLPTIYSV